MNRKIVNILIMFLCAVVLNGCGTKFVRHDVTAFTPPQKVGVMVVDYKLNDDVIRPGKALKFCEYLGMMVVDALKKENIQAQYVGDLPEFERVAQEFDALPRQKGAFGNNTPWPEYQQGPIILKFAVDAMKQNRLDALLIVGGFSLVQNPSALRGFGYLAAEATLKAAVGGTLGGGTQNISVIVPIAFSADGLSSYGDRYSFGAFKHGDLTREESRSHMMSYVAKEFVDNVIGR